MNTNQSKPSLEALLQSKKYDLPNDEFWNILQDSVKGKALASLAEQPLSHRFLKSSFLILPVLLLTFFFFVFILFRFLNFTVDRVIQCESLVDN